MEIVFDQPTSEGVQAAYEVARQWLPAFVAGKRAEEHLYAPGVSTWHNIGEWEAPIHTTPSRTRRVNAGAVLGIDEVKCTVFDGGFVLQAVTIGTSADGRPVRVPTVLIVTVTNGQIARFEEYADSAASKALFGEEVDAIRDEHANFTSE